MFPYHIQVKIKNNGDKPFRMGPAVAMPGASTLVSAQYVTAPAVAKAEAAGVEFECLMIAGKPADFSFQEKAPRLKMEVKKVEVKKLEPVVEEEPEPVVEEEPEPVVEPEVEEEADPVDLSSMKKSELKAMAEDMGLDTGGLKADLIARIEEAL